MDQSTAMADLGGKKHRETVTYILELCLLPVARSSLEGSYPLFWEQVANKAQQETWDLTRTRIVCLWDTQKVEPWS
jgi:hypothetical protein